MMKIKTLVILFIITIMFIVLSGFSNKKAQAESYPCQTYSGTNECIDLSISSSCNGTSPTVTWKWTKKFNSTSFTIVYSRNGNWYMKTLGNVTSWTMTTPPFGGPGSGGTDNTPLKAGEYISGKISGGTAPNIKTGYTNPDVATTVKNCATPTTPPTAPPTTNPTPTTPPATPGPTTPPGTTGILALQFPGIGLNDNTNPLHPTRQIILYFYPVSDTSFQHTPFVATGIVTYNPTTGYFSNLSFPLTGLSAGSYLVLVRTLQGSLVSQIGTGDGTGPITIVITGGQNYLVDTQNQQDQNADITVPTLSMGAFADDCSSSGCNFNTVNLLDWSYLTDCFGSKSSSTACTAHGTFPNTSDTVTDLNDDGHVDGTDYTMLLANFGLHGIGQQSMNRGNPPQ